MSIREKLRTREDELKAANEVLVTKIAQTKRPKGTLQGNANLQEQIRENNDEIFILRELITQLDEIQKIDPRMSSGGIRNQEEMVLIAYIVQKQRAWDAAENKYLEFTDSVETAIKVGHFPVYNHANNCRCANCSVSRSMEACRHK